MTEERIKELALKLTDKIYDLLPIDKWGRRNWEFQYRKELQAEIEKCFRTVAAEAREEDEFTEKCSCWQDSDGDIHLCPKHEAREEGRIEGIEEMRDAAIRIAPGWAPNFEFEAERLEEKGK